MLTNTGRPSARNAARRAGVKAWEFAATTGVVPGSATSRATAASAPQPATMKPNRPPRCCACPHAHAENASSTAPAAAPSTPDAPACRLMTHNSHAAAAYIGNASAPRSTSIQAPGRGSSRATPGTSAKARNGAANPSPNAPNTSSATGAGAASATANAAPINGAVQGVATSTASSPVAYEPSTPPRDASPCPAPAPANRTSNTPDRFRPTISSTHASTVTNSGDCSWNPQPTDPPAARNAINAKPNAPNAVNTPSV